MSMLQSIAMDQTEHQDVSQPDAMNAIGDSSTLAEARSYVSRRAMDLGDEAMLYGALGLF